MPQPFLDPPPDEATVLPHDLTGPVGVMLAKIVERIPASGALPGGCVYEPKWDGFRLAVVRGPARARLWSRQGRELTAQFPEIADAATAQLRPGTVLDGEVVIWHGDRTDFGLLQQRNLAGPRRIAGLVAAHPASYVAFDLLADAGTDMRHSRLLDRRARLEALADRWSPPLNLTPATTDADEAAAWFKQWRIAGLEGLVVKALDAPYRPGRREWLKVKHREAVDVIVGGVIGARERPDELVVGRYRANELVIVGRTSPLTPAQAVEVGRMLTPAGDDHPWPARIGSGAFGGSDRLSVPLIRVRPDLVAEVLVDVALSGGVWRHPLRFVRLRTDLTPRDVTDLA